MFCHKNGIIHRDLKPENILIENYIEKNKELFNIQVIDFGTGEIFKDNTMLKKQIGTPYYIAPEVLNNKYNEKCDLWSCGVIMFILLCGCPPFYGKSDEEIFASVRAGSFSFSHKVWNEISDSAKDLIEKLLEIDIDKRLSAEKALKHKWFTYFCKSNDNKTFETEDNLYTDKEGGESLNCLKDALTNLKNFRAERKLQQATLYFMVHNMIPTQEKLRLREIFMKMDENMDGRLTKEEVLKGFKKSKMIKCSNKEIKTIMDSVDLDKNGFIEYQEFLTATVDVKKLLTDQNLKKAFEMFDKDNSGNISAEEIQKVLGMDNSHSEQTWKRIVNEIDSDGDGEISFEEFKVMMHSLITSI
jgi:calcium-dependent protein kinase